MQSWGRVSSRGLSLRTPGFRVPLRGLIGVQGFRDEGLGIGVAVQGSFGFGVEAYLEDHGT